MAASDYYAAHPQNNAYGLSPQPPSIQMQHVPEAGQYGPGAINTSYGPYRDAAAQNNSNLHLNSQFDQNSHDGSSDASSDERGLFSHSNENKDKSKAERAVKFVGKMVEKQVMKKLNGGQHQGGGGHGEQFQEFLGGQGQQDGGGYGYGNGEYAYGNGDYSSSHGLDSLYGGDHGAGASTGLSEALADPSNGGGGGWSDFFGGAGFDGGDGGGGE